jgi:tetratricopeptide (TPR) repeat protein
VIPRAGLDTDPALTASWQYGAEGSRQLLTLGEGIYMMHPSLLLNPFILAAYLLGVPFLLWRLRKIAAQLLLGVLLFVPILVYVPPVATLIGNIFGSWHLWRLAWPLPLAALLTLGWVTWELLAYARSRLSRFEVFKKGAPLLPLIFVTLLIGGTAPLALAGVKTADNSGEVSQEETDCQDPAFHWMRGALAGPSTVLAPDAENSCISAYAAQARVVTYRYQQVLNYSSPEEQSSSEELQRILDVNRFFGYPVLDEEMLDILRRREIDYVLLPTYDPNNPQLESPLSLQLENLPGFTALDTPGERYRLYRVDRTELEATPAVEGNTHLNNKDLDLAIASYSGALQGDENEQLLAYVGLGGVYEAEGLYTPAASYYTRAIALRPDLPILYVLLAQAYAKGLDVPSALPSARAALERAVALDPRNVRPRFLLGERLLKMNEEKEALDQYQTVVGMFPEVPRYRLRLAEALGKAGYYESSRQELEKATSFAPLSAELQWEAGQAAEKSGQPEGAAQYYERTLELDPDAEFAAQALRNLDR